MLELKKHFCILLRETRQNGLQLQRGKGNKTEHPRISGLYIRDLISWNIAEKTLCIFCSTGLDNTASDLLVFHAGTKRGDGSSGKRCILTSGGRVLAVVAVRASVTAAIEDALSGVTAISFPDIYYRRDIGQKALSG